MQSVRSSLPGILWPAVPGGDAATALAMQLQLEQSQWWTPQQIVEHQFRQLQSLYRHAWHTVPFYRQRLEAAGLAPDIPLDPETWQRLPVVRRPEFQAAGDSLFTTALPAGHGKAYPGVTSGSTGRAVHFLNTGITSFFWRAFTLRDHLWHQRDLSGTLAAIRFVKGTHAMAPHGTSVKGWGPATDLVYSTGPAHLLNSSSSIREQWDWLQTINPDYLLSHPSNLLALARHAMAHGGTLTGLKEARTVGEPVTMELRAACRDAWDVPLVDFYTAKETGYITLQCPHHDHYHVQAENVYVEIIDADGRACRPGQVGEVVVSNLNNFASPMLRYSLGDRARAGAPCDRGRGLPVIEEILGRERNMLILPNGDSHWPVFGLSHLAEIADIHQFQAIQLSTTQIEARLVTPAPLSPEQETAVRAVLIEKLGYPFDILITYHDEIPRDPSGKFEDFKSLVTAP